MWIVLEVFAILLVAQKRVLIHPIIDPVDLPALLELLRAVLAVSGVVFVDQVLGAVVAFLLVLVGLELEVLLGALVRGQGVLAEVALVALEVEVRALVVLFVVELLGLAGFVLAVRGLEALDHVPLLVALLDFLLQGVFACVSCVLVRGN